ncbi:MAG: mannitol dehydrogenase family protein, partial [Pseudomonadales bacterium]|nr:mannitol dehydrogenase family protein [Pseudomonadales bacterium]
MLTQNQEHKAAELSAPPYDRSALKPYLLHIGFGNFFRAHTAFITDQLARTGDSRWGITIVNLFKADGIRQLRQQNHLYSVTQVEAKAKQEWIIGSVIASLHPVIDGLPAIMAALSAPELKVLSLTITEKGYGLSPATGKLDLTHPLIVADLKSPETPRSAIGVLVEGLRQRYAACGTPVTILSCDNLAHNGDLTRNAVVAFATQRSAELAHWIENNCTFPNTMVDRMVPKLSAEIRASLNPETLALDQLATACEPYCQWVIEDRFANGKPEWDRVGVNFVDSIAPYEMMKLRLLNASHSFLAYLGLLAGYKTISETMGDQSFRRAVIRLMLDEQAPTLKLPPEISLNDYINSIVNRFENPLLHHRTQQIAIDGSQKLQQRIIPSIQYHFDKGTDYTLLVLTVAAWMRYASGISERGGILEVQDPLANELKRIYIQHGLRDQVVDE